MPVPKRKASKCRRNSRKSANQVVTASSFMDCKNCGQVCLPHVVCKNCGFYKGQKVMETKLDRAMRRGESRKDRVQANEPMTTQPEEVEVIAKPKRVKAAGEKVTKAKKENKD